jgi:hypothetical protein
VGEESEVGDDRICWSPGSGRIGLFTQNDSKSISRHSYSISGTRDSKSKGYRCCIKNSRRLLTISAPELLNLFRTIESPELGYRQHFFFYCWSGRAEGKGHNNIQLITWKPTPAKQKATTITIHNTISRKLTCLPAKELFICWFATKEIDNKITSKWWLSWKR